MLCIPRDNEICAQFGYYYTDCRFFRDIVNYSSDQPLSENDGYLLNFTRLLQNFLDSVLNIFHKQTSR